MDLADPIAACLHRHSLDDSTGVIAVSGGPDSVALAHVCVEMMRAGKLPRLILGHVNHQLRGAESDADACFVQQLPAMWHMAGDGRLSCAITSIDISALAEAEHANLESIARRERYDWLTRLAQDAGARWIATGHSADDQAETVLFRLLRGSGLLGLGGITACRPAGRGVSLVRPLLTTRRRALLDYLRDKQIPYCTDSSNRDLRFTRNRMRLELMPMLEQHYNSTVVDVLCRLADQSQEWSADIVKQAEQLRCEAELPRAGPLLVFAADRLQGASANLVREMFRLVWQREGWPMADMDFARWHWLVEFVQGSRDVGDFPGRIQVRRVGHVLQLGPIIRR